MLHLFQSMSIFPCIRHRHYLPMAAIVIGLLSTGAFANDQAPRLGMLHWVGGNQLSRANTDGSDYQVLVSNLNLPDGLTLDLLNSTMYWSNMGYGPEGSVQRARLDGSPVVSGEEHIVAPGRFETGKEIELDPVDNKLYWADRDGKHIMRSNVDGSALESVLHSFTDEQGKVVALENPVGIALDSDRRQVYMTDRFMGKVMRFNMAMPANESNENRSDVEVLIAPRSTDDRPIDIDLDLENGLMYWTDRGVHQVLRARLDGSAPTVLVDKSKVAIEDPIGMSLDLANRKMYWSDMTTHKIHRANLDGSAIEEIIGGEKILNGIAYGPLGVQYRALEPEQGSVAGGETVAVLGSHFVKGKTEVTLGEQTSVAANVISSNLLTFTTPPGKQGMSALTVRTPHGEASLPNAYRYR